MINTHITISIKKLILFLIFIVVTPILLIGARVYYLQCKAQTFESCADAINFTLQHKTVFWYLYQYNKMQEERSKPVAEAPIKNKKKKARRTKDKKPISERLTNWLSERIIYHIETNSTIKTIDDLPMLERSVIKSLDGASYMGKLYQRLLYYVTRTQK